VNWPIDPSSLHIEYRHALPVYPALVLQIPVSKYQLPL